MLNFFFAELRRNWIMLRRYPLQALSSTVLMLILFMTLLGGIRYVAGPAQQFGDRLDTLIVGYVLWNTLIFAMGEISGGLQGEAKIGTLEQLFLSPLSGTRVFLLRALAAQTVTIAFNVVTLGFLLLITRTTLHFPPGLFIPLASALAACYGLGLVLGSLALVFKRVEAVIQISQFGLITLVMVPFETWQGGSVNPYYLLPLVPSAALLRDLMVRGQSLDPAVLLVALLNGTVYLVLGSLVFRWAERTTKQQGLLGTY
ncbi:MAG TPA: ABC transporter permease [Longimicrobiaceae bacterium]